jgi:hypothetical protein
MTPGQKLVAWLLLTPLVSLMNLLVIKPAMYWATTKAKTTGWGTRQPAALSSSKPLALEGAWPRHEDTLQLQTVKATDRDAAAALYDPWADSTEELTRPAGLRDAQETW